MPAAFARLRRLLAGRRGSFLVEYSSLALLIALAAIALFAEFGNVPGAGTP